MKKPLKIFLITVVSLIVLGACIFYLARIAFNESLYFRRYSIAYFLVGQPIIKDFPRILPVNKPLYRSDCEDGAKAPSQSIKYLSKERKEILFSQIEQYLFKHGYKIAKNLEEVRFYEGITYEKGYEIAQLFIKTNEKDQQEVSFIVIDNSVFHR